MAEKLVLASGPISLLSAAPRLAQAIEIQNLGPNSIWVTLDGSTPVVDKCRKVGMGEVWAFTGVMCRYMDVKAIASTADQITGAATIVNELH